MKQGVQLRRGVEVSAGGQRNRDVRERHRRSEPRESSRLLRTERREYEGRQEQGDHDNEPQSGGKTPETSQVKGGEGDATVGIVIAQQRQGDDKSRDHEKHVHADKPARHKSPHVEGDDGEDSEGPKALDVRSPVCVVHPTWTA